MVRLVLFDIDGTLIRTDGAGVSAFDRTAEATFGIRNGVGRMRFAGRTDKSLVRELFSDHRIEPSQANYERFFSCYVFLLEDCMRKKKGRVYAGALNFLNDLRSMAQRPVIGLLTGNIRLGAEIKLRHFGLWDSFAIGAFGDDDEDRNELARIALSRGARILGGRLRGEEVLVVGDTPFDVECARAIGARVVAVATGGATFETLARHRPDWLVSDLGRLTAARVCGDMVEMT